MKIFYHNKDMDGYASGAILKRKYPDAEFIGWDYADNVPEINSFINEDIILIDITFKIEILQEICIVAKSVTVIDHHISFYKSVQSLKEPIGFNYIYDINYSACELGYKYCYPDKEIPKAIALIGDYDIWRNFGTTKWETEVLPFHYYMYGKCNSMDSIPEFIFENNKLDEFFEIGNHIKNYEFTMNQSLCEKNSFEKIAYGGYKCLCINYYPFSSYTLDSKWDDTYDFVMGFAYIKGKWGVSLRSRGDFDVSEIAKARGGGGHKNAAGFEVTKFEDIWK